MNAPTLAVDHPALRASAITQRQGLTALGGAVVVGVAGDLLLREVPWGLNLLLWTGVLTVAAARIGGRASLRGWAPLVLAAAALAVWRDSPVLKALDLIAIGVVLALASWHRRGGRLWQSGLVEQLLAVIEGFFAGVAGAIQLTFQDVRWNEVPRGATSRQAGAVLRGLAIALPVVTVFAMLLTSADARFAGFLGGLFQVDVPSLMGHLLLSTACAWQGAGVLRALPQESGGDRARTPALPEARLGVVEVATVLGLVNALFLAFVILQIPYFFGDAEAVRGAGHLNFADYARHGFFELVAVAGLVVPELLALHWFQKPQRRLDLYLFRGFAWMQVILVAVIMASALHRMRLYQVAYGLTELRVYTTAFMLWIGAVLAWLCGTVLQGHRDRFAFGALVAGGIAVAGLHAANPDALIARVNTGRLSEARLDAGYLSRLSADAAPVLRAALPRMSTEDRCTVARSLERRWGGGSDPDWRAWSWGRARAGSAVRGDLTAGCPPVPPDYTVVVDPAMARKY
jgi:hypothetical protein